MIFIKDFIDPSAEEMMSCIRGMRNPMNSWDKSDSGYCSRCWSKHLGCDNCGEDPCGHPVDEQWHLGKEDKKLMIKLAKAGSEHRKFMRMMPVQVTVLAPLYWWKEFETYRVGVAPSPADIDFNSCSTMHKITSKEFQMDDFAHEHLDIRARDSLEKTIRVLNDYRKLYVEYDPKKFEIEGCPSKKDIWWQLIQLLPSSYMQEKTISMNYEVLAHIYKQRKDHKLDEWRMFCNMIEQTRYFFLIEEIIKPVENKYTPRKAAWRPMKEYYDVFFDKDTVNCPVFIFIKKTDGDVIVARFAGTANGWRDTNNEYIDERSLFKWFDPTDIIA